MTRFLALGEIMVELAPASGGLFRRGYAGDTFNCAWYARQLLPDDWSVSYGTVLGKDAVCDDICTFISDAGIQTDAVARVADRTVGLYMIQTDHGERSFSYWRGQSAARLLGDDPEWLDRILAGRSVVQFSGITLAILAPLARQVLCDALARARAAGTLIAFDTNLRPRLWDGPDDMRAGLTLGASVSDIVLPSFDEEQLAFGDTTPQDTIARYSGLGARIVVVKDGGDNCHLWCCDQETVQYAPPTVTQVVDSTAAGDSFVAGFLAAYMQDSPPIEAVKQACNLAGQVIQRPGALARDIFKGETQT